MLENGTLAGAAELVPADVLVPPPAAAELELLLELLPHAARATTSAPVAIVVDIHRVVLMVPPTVPFDRCDNRPASLRISACRKLLSLTFDTA
jgi:hypothetical protein